MKTKYRFLSFMITSTIVTPIMLIVTTNFFYDNVVLKSNLQATSIIGVKDCFVDVWTPIKQAAVIAVDSDPTSIDIENIDLTYKIQVNNELTINPTVKIIPDSEQKNVTWILVSALIDGLSLNPTSGAIKYLPTTTGEYVLQIQARSNINNLTSAIKESTITVIENDQPIPSSSYNLPLIITCSVMGVLTFTGIISAVIFNAKKKSKKA